MNAVGLLTSDLRHDFAISRPIRSDDPQAPEKLASAYRELEELALKELGNDPDFSPGAARDRRCDMRYAGQAYDVSVPLIADPADPAAWDELQAAFHEEHRRAYAFAEPDEPCELRTQRLSLTVRVGSRLKIPMVRVEARGPSRSVLVKIAGENVECPVIERVTLHPGSTVPVPSLVVQDDATTYIPPGVTTKVAPTGDLLITGLSR